MFTSSRFWSAGGIFLFSANMLVAPTSGSAQVTGPETLRVSVSRYVGSAHNYVAFDKGFFRKNGVDVELMRSDTGLNSVRAMLRGESDIAMISPTPVVFGALDPDFFLGEPAPEFVILANLIQSTSLNAVVVRADVGIKTPRDLEGKTLALALDTGSEYYWYTYALYHGIDTSKVRTLDSSVGDLRINLELGTVDAFTVWEPNVGRIRRATSVPTTELPGQKFFSAGWLVLAKRDFAQRNVAAIERYLAALRDAEDFLRENQDELAKILSRLIDMPADEALRLQRKMTFNMVLDEAMIINLEEQAKWRVQSKYDGKRAIPDFRALVFEKPLLAVKPSSVNLLR